MSRDLRLTPKTLSALTRVGYRREEDLVTIGDDVIDNLDITPGQQVLLLDYTRQARARAANAKPKPENSQLCQQECISERNMVDEACELAKDYVRENGVQGLPKVIDLLNTQYMSSHLLLAVIGGSGNGKSTLINSLRGLRACDAAYGAATVGETETTMKPTAYRFPKAHNVRLWDLPGVNTPGYKRDNYLKKVNFHKYDAFIIVCSKRFTQDDLWLSKEAHSLGKPYFFVRTKFDEDVQNFKRDTNGQGDVELMFDRVQMNIRKNLQEGGLPNDRIYIISGVLQYQTQWDFPQLVNDLTRNISKKNRTALIMAIVTSSEEVIDQRAKLLRERLHVLKEAQMSCCTSDVTMDDLHVKAADSNDDMEWVEIVCIKSEIKTYTRILGISKEELVDIDLTQLGPQLQGVVQELENMECHEIPEYTRFREFVNFWLKGFAFSLAKWIDEKCDPKKARTRQNERHSQGLNEAFDILDLILESCVKAAKEVLNQRRQTASARVSRV